MADEAKRAFRNAMEFHEAAIRCDEFVPDPSNDKEFHSAETPSIVCIAFAAELYLKTLLLNRGAGIKDEHRLLELYHKLNDDERRIIARHFETRRGAPEERMLRELASVSSVFVQWRYAHELPRSIDLGALRAFAESAYLAVRDLNPDWHVAPYLDDRILNTDVSMIFVGVFGGDEGEFNRTMQKSIVRTLIARSQPQPNIIEGEQHNLSLAAPTLNLDSQAATLNITVRGRANSENGGTGESIE